MAERPISHREAEQLRWLRVDPKPWSKLDARWLHVLGWRLEHCGHPTALTPWALYNPSGRMVLTGALREGERNDAGEQISPFIHGTAWPSLRLVMSYVASPRARAHDGKAVRHG